MSAEFYLFILFTQLLTPQNDFLFTLTLFVIEDLCCSTIAHPLLNTSGFTPARLK